MRCAIELNSMHEVEKFAAVVNGIDEDVWLEGYDEKGHCWCMNAKLLLASLVLPAKAQKLRCNAHNVDWNTLYCRCDKDIYCQISDFVKE